MKGLKRKHVKRIILLLVVIICFNIIASNLSCVEAATEDTTSSSGLAADFAEGNKQLEGDSISDRRISMNTNYWTN